MLTHFIGSILPHNDQVIIVDKGISYLKHFLEMRVMAG